MLRTTMILGGAVLDLVACSTVVALPSSIAGDGSGGCAECQVAAVASSASGSGGAGVVSPLKSACVAAVVSNAADPSKTGKGIPSRWTFAGHIGLEAGEELCRAAGADHVCSLEEILAADAAGDLADLPRDITFWSYRTKPVLDPLLDHKPCKVDDGWEKPADRIGNTSDCEGGLGHYCDPERQLCSLKPGVGGRCNDFTYPTGHLWDGEWFARADATVASFPAGGTRIGSLILHFDADVQMGHVCGNPSALGCAGPCGGAGLRAIVCCKKSCGL